MTNQSPSFATLSQVARYAQSLARDPKSTDFVPLAETFRQCGLLAEACAVAEKGVQTLPDHGPGHIVLGRIQAQLGELSHAMSSFESALVLDENDPDAIKGLARVCALAGQPSRARTLLLRMLQLQPGDASAEKMLAGLPPEPAPVVVPPVAKGEEKTVETMDAPRRRSSAPANAPISTVTIAEIYVRQGFTQRALKVYRDLLQADPHNAEIRRKLVELKARIEREGGAEALAEAELEDLGQEAAAGAPVQSAGVEEPVLEGASGRVARLEKWLVAIQQRRGHV